MKRLFLASFFAQTSELCADFMDGGAAGKRVLFIPTAANPEKVKFFVGADRKALQALGFAIDELDVAAADAAEIAERISRADAVFVGGGNTFYLLQQLRRSGADAVIRGAVLGGLPYIGSSAGSIVLSPDIGYIRAMDPPAKAPGLDDFRGLGLVDFHPLPHFGNAPFKKTGERIQREYGGRIDLRPLSNDQALVVRGEEAILRSADQAR